MQIGPREIAQRLADQAEGVCRYLLPGGRKVGNDWTAGNVYGSEGKSLKVALSGSKAGVGADFSDPDSFSGDLLDLWKSVRGCTMREAILEAKAYLGIEQAESYRKKTYRKVTRPKNVRKRMDEVTAYLNIEREIGEKTIEAFKIASTTEREIVFPILAPGGKEVLNLKYLGLDRPDGKKRIRAEAGCAPSFFGWQAIDTLFPDPAEVVITEGEIDAMTWVDNGFPALSVPSGSNSTAEAIAYDWDNLAQFEAIYLCPDQDAAGKKMVDAFADRIGKARLRVIKLPFKDANEAKKNGWTEDDFAKAIMEAKGLMDEKILTYPQAIDDIMAWKNKGGDEGPRGYAIDLFGEDIRIVRGHAFLIGGQRGHGKSLIVNQASLEIAKRGDVVAVASLEVDTIEAMAAMLDLYSGKIETTPEIRDDFMEVYGERFVFLKEHGRTPLFAVMEFFEYARSRYGATHFILDNLTKLKTKLDDYAQQAEDLNRITDYCRDKKVCVWIVAHLKKRGEKKHDMDPDDVRGSGVIADLCSTILQVVRHKDKPMPSPGEVDTAPDATIHCTKQRIGGGKEPTIHLRKMAGEVVRLARREERKANDDDGRSGSTEPLPYKD